jgi:hypothetical protein
MNNSFNPQRRRFLKVGLIGSAALTVAAGGVMLSQQSETCNDCSWLQQNDRELLLAIIPVMLAGALPADKNQQAIAVNEIITGFDITLSHFPPVVRDEIRQLLWLLEFPVTRSLIAGVWSAWDKVEDHAVIGFLKSWQHSRLDLLRVGYAALHDLISGAWYANPRSWQRINYPGPPVIS